MSFSASDGEIWMTKKGKTRKYYVPKYPDNPNLTLAQREQQKTYVLKNFDKAETDWQSVDFNNTRRNKRNETHNIRIASWNVGGLQDWLKNNCTEYLKHENPDILCLQETCSPGDMLINAVKTSPRYYHYVINGTTKYLRFGVVRSGVAIFSRKRPLRVYYGFGDERLDQFGLVMAAEFENFTVVSVHLPYTIKRCLNRTDFVLAFTKFVVALDQIKPVVVLGDMKVAMTYKDIKWVTANTAKTIRSRQHVEEFELFMGRTRVVDTFRHLYPKERKYTCWPYQDPTRKKNRGWRSDYALVSERLQDQVCDSVMRDNVFGVRHCPIVLFLRI